MPLKVLTNVEQRAILAMLEHGDPSIQKRGLQRLSNQLQNGGRLVDASPVEARLAALRQSPDVKVRSWLYNAIARMRTGNFRDYLAYQIIFNENDIENVTWATAAFFSTAPPGEIETLLRSPNVYFFNSPLELSSQLYYDGPITSQIEQRPFERQVSYDPLFAKWYALLFGYDRSDKRIREFSFPHAEYVSSLNRHHNDEVAEYSLWSLFMSSTGGLDDASLTPDEAVARNSNIRRWFYRLIAKSAISILDHVDFIKSQIAEELDPVAKEGLAIGLSRHYLPQLSEAMLEWFLSEPNDLVKLALAPHFARFAGRNAEYEELVVTTLTTPQRQSIINTIISATVVRERPTSRLVQLVGRLERQKTADAIVVKIKGGVHMNSENKSVTNIAYGGNVSVGNINLGTIEASTLDAVSRMQIDSSSMSQFKSALEKYAKLIAVDGSVPPEDKVILHEVVQELAQLHEKPNEQRSGLARRAAAALKGVIAALPATAVLAQETHALIAEVAKLFYS